MNRIGFDFSKFVDTSFKTTLTHFVSLPIAIEILMMFMIEGVKILFRYTYAVMKCNKQFIKKCTDPATLLELLRHESKEKSLPHRIHKRAFKYPLKRKNYNYSRAQIDKYNDPYSQIG